MGLTFKKEAKETGLARIANPEPSTQVKFNKRQVGTIVPNCLDVNWLVRICIETDPNVEEPCGWKWITFKARFETEPQAREWLQQNWEKLQTYKIHSFDPD